MEKMSIKDSAEYPVDGAQIHQDCAYLFNISLCWFQKDIYFYSQPSQTTWEVAQIVQIRMECNSDTATKSPLFE